MPAAPLWIHRLPDTLPALASLPQDLIGRRTLQELLVVGKWTAGRILRQCGADEGPGGALVCPCDALVERLRVIQQDGRCTTEIARPERVELYLDGMLQFASRKHKEIARDTAGVELQPGVLRIDFSGANDFLQKFEAVVFALNNDWERVREFLEVTGATAEAK